MINIYQGDDTITKIHKKRLSILIQQAKLFGPGHVPPHILTEIKFISGQIREIYGEQINQNGRRLQYLKLKKAVQGINSDPAVDIEIEDLDTLIVQLQSRFEELEKYTK